ncbi:MAG: cytochrome c [Bacteroidia bacterium]
MKTFNTLFLSSSALALLAIGLFAWFGLQGGWERLGREENPPLAIRTEVLKLAAGKLLFEKHCSACHKPATCNNFTINARSKYADRLPWLYDFVRDSQKLVAEGDPEATMLFEQYSRQVMPAFSDLSDGEIDAILVYMESMGK